MSERPWREAQTGAGASTCKGEEFWPGDASLQQTSVLGPGDGCATKPEGNANEIQGVVADCYKGRPGSSGSSLGSTSHLQSSTGSSSMSVLPQTSTQSPIDKKPLSSQAPCHPPEQTVFEGQFRCGEMDESGHWAGISGVCATETAAATALSSGLGFVDGPRCRAAPLELSCSIAAVEPETNQRPFLPIVQVSATSPPPLFQLKQEKYSVRVCIRPSPCTEPLAQLLLTDTHLGLVQEDAVFHPTPSSVTVQPCRPLFHHLTLRQRSDVRCVLVHDEDKRGAVWLDVILANCDWHQQSKCCGGDEGYHQSSLLWGLRSPIFKPPDKQDQAVSKPAAFYFYGTQASSGLSLIKLQKDNNRCFGSGVVLAHLMRVGKFRTPCGRHRNPLETPAFTPIFLTPRYADTSLRVGINILQYRSTLHMGLVSHGNLLSPIRSSRQLGFPSILPSLLSGPATSPSIPLRWLHAPASHNQRLSPAHNHAKPMGTLSPACGMEAAICDTSSLCGHQTCTSTPLHPHLVWTNRLEKIKQPVIEFTSQRLDCSVDDSASVSPPQSTFWLQRQAQNEKSCVLPCIGVGCCTIQMMLQRPTERAALLMASPTMDSGLEPSSCLILEP
ncbi:unnamed protein product [Pleuronectes platessa]|uniref:Uncharacterized protein n=1 Tax=Pleuronectes platessa TaxID=8262 RepID=A0A9N7VQW7_PLEPL|nr:unnamed protein product [Pleuronectes platessa]